MESGLVVGILALLVALATLYYQRRQTLMAETTQKFTRQTSSFNGGTLALVALVALAWGPFVWQKFQPKALPDTPIGEYGIGPQPFTFHAKINTAPLKDKKETDRLMLIVRLQYANIDRMSDTFIDKSVPYTLDGSEITMTVVGKMKPAALRVDPAVSTMSIEYDAVLIPQAISADQIRSLNDVEHLGGKILSDRSQTVPFSSLGVTVSPPQAPPKQ